VKLKYGSVGILGHSLRNKIPIVGNQEESAVGSMKGWEQTVDPLIHTCLKFTLAPDIESLD
jgi:hypothetical protein